MPVPRRRALSSNTTSKARESLAFFAFQLEHLFYLFCQCSVEGLLDEYEWLQQQGHDGVMG
jgi:hypothetical protein